MIICPIRRFVAHVNYGLPGNQSPKHHFLGIEKDKIKREKEEKKNKKKNNNEYIRYLEECNNQLIDIINFQEYVESDKFNKDILKEITPYLRYINSF